MKIELKLTLIAVCALTLALVGYVNDVEAAAYLKFDGVDGEATDTKHKEWIEVLSFSQTITRETSDSSGTTRTRGSATMGDIVVVKELDKSSPKLAESILIGKVFPKVEIHLTSSAGTTYYAYELTNVMVTSYSISGDADQVPMEEFSLNFEDNNLLLKPNQKQPKAYPKNSNIAYLDQSKIQYPLTIRRWQKGDTFQPLGMHGKRKKVQDLFTNLKLSIFEKECQL